MKFGKQLEQYELPEWRGHYIPYKDLKHALDKLKPPHANITFSDDMRLTPNTLEEPHSSWHRRVTDEAHRVGDFVERGLRGLADQLLQLSSMVESLRPSIADSGESSVPEVKEEKVKKTNDKKDAKMDADVELQDENANSDKTKKKKKLKEHKGKDKEQSAFEDIEIRAIEGVGRVIEGMRRLRGFAELNHAALYKILKKHDKVLNSQYGLGTLFPKIVEDSKLGDMSRFDELSAELSRLSLGSSLTEGLNATPEVARLAAGLGFQSHASRGSLQNELILSFFFGLSIAFMVSICILLWLPEWKPRTFSTGYFLAPMPVFRVVFSVVLVLWCLGFVAKTCDNADINHMFILRVDPKCRVTSNWLFSRAAVLTTLWVLAFGMYVLDYKWGVLPVLWSKYGYNKRASFHFVFYPVFLLGCTFVGMALPSYVCRNRYKSGLLRSIGRTMATPFYPVDFADNIVGDVLTSLAKPLQDIPAATCYLMQPHPQTQELVEQFMAVGHTCNVSIMIVIMPLIAGLPYLFRALQCLRRYRDSVVNEHPDVKHLFNCGKYIVSVCVVLAGAICPTRTYVVVAISLLATAYAGIWDLAIDWGLGRNELFGHANFSLWSMTEQESSAGGAKNFDRQASVGAANLEGHVTSAHVGNPDRFLSKRVYWVCSVLDIILRCTWVFTLMPLHIFTENIVGRVVFVSIISSAEVIRRSVWAVLRIENEQRSNASGFRALLWVPSKLNAEDQHNGLESKRTDLLAPLLAPTSAGA